MHELGLAKDILAKIDNKKVKVVKVKVGETRVHDPEELKEIFKDISGGIELELEIVPVKAVCANCKKEFDGKELRLDCPHCKSTNINITSGQELEVSKNFS